jgi:16S rRNA (cytosine967-C5)-methyltransferase
MNTRAIAAKILYQVLAKHTALDDALSLHCDSKIPERDRALIQEFCYGTLRWFHRLDYLAESLLHKPTNKLDSVVHALLLLGLYQLLYLRIPEHAAIAETVSAARLLKKNWATALINAVLREFVRDKENYLQAFEANIVALHSHPRWLIEELQQSWPKKWQDILNTNNNHPPMHLRVNLSSILRDAYLHKLADAKIGAQVSTETKAGISLDQPVPVSKLPGFNKGLVSVQDLAGQLASELLDLKKGQYILDACAAPGGKTSAILEAEPALAEMVALDISEERLQKISANLQRLDLHAKLVVGDACEPTKWWSGRLFDRILLDAPCSATGVIRRHPDIKILRQQSDVVANANKQLTMLEELWQLLVPDGILLYATCSVLPQENSLLIARFLANHPDAKELSINHSWQVKTEHGCQILPTVNGPDGFFYAKLLRRIG